MNDVKIRKMTAIAMLSAIAYILMFYIRIPVVLFLKYEPKDIVIVIGGFLMGPMASFLISVLVSFIEMITVSETGIIGFIMNVLASCSFACTAAYVYKKKKSIRGAVIGLLSGTIVMVLIMLLWNYLVTPLYMKIPREAVKSLLIPAILPFNLLKGGLNSAISFLLYKPVVRTLRKTKLVPQSENKNKKFSAFSVVAVLIIITCVLGVLAFNKII